MTQIADPKQFGCEDQNCVLFGLGRFPISTAIFFGNKKSQLVFLLGLTPNPKELANDDAELSDLKDRWSQSETKGGNLERFIMQIKGAHPPNATEVAGLKIRDD